ncbi:hypothetical protein KFU94_61805 [Chloroflexi bacterium TSY]|nr:hypothetical protein [Chloroflexi bacterium TSY]
MMTKRLYYTDSYQQTFIATVVNKTVVNAGTFSGNSAIILNETAFYPTSGGQAHDEGSLNEHRIIDVIAGKGDEILHVLEKGVAEIPIGASVEGVIDWSRRYDHMQQHSGQHLLSYTFDTLFGIETVSVHFGEQESTLDLDVEDIDPKALEQVEAHTNEIVYRNRPITAYFVDEAQIDSIPLRRPPQVKGKIRIVEIEKLDYSACGGTHCRGTGELGPIKLLRKERNRGRTRITFLCGLRALDDYNTKHRLISEAAAMFSTEMNLVPEMIGQLQEQNKELNRQIDKLSNRIRSFEAEQMLASAPLLGEIRLLAQRIDDDVANVKKLASLLQEQSTCIALLVATHSEKPSVIFSRSSTVNLDMGALLRETLGKFGGGGGGRPDFAQGGGVLMDDVDKLLDYASQLAISTMKPS